MLLVQAVMVSAQADLVTDTLTDGCISTCLQESMTIRQQSRSLDGQHGVHGNSMSHLGLELGRLGTVVTDVTQGGDDMGSLSVTGGEGQTGVAQTGKCSESVANEGAENTHGVTSWFRGWI